VKRLLLRATVIMTTFLNPAIHAQAPAAVTYQNPPDWVAWIEGEAAVGSNWTPGESHHNWWHEYAGVTGRGVLELASHALPATGAYVATYEFTLPAAGTYELYWRGRVPGYQASPVYWSVNGGAERRQPAAGGNASDSMVDQVVNWKMALVDLGAFQGLKGKNRLTLSVRDFLFDHVQVAPGAAARQQPFIVQGLDSLLVAKVRYREQPERLAVLQAKPGADFVIDFMAGVNPATAGFGGAEQTPVIRNWAGYDKLAVEFRVTGDGKAPFNGRLRCYYQGSSFRDLPLVVEPAEFGKFVTREFDLGKEFAGVSRGDIHLLWLYTYDKWYTQSASYRVEVPSVTLSARNALARQPLVVPPAGRPAPGLAEAKAKQMSQFVWNEAPKTDAAHEVVERDGGDTQTVAPVPFAAGELTAELSPVTGGLRRLALGGDTLIEVPAAAMPVQVTFLDGSVWSPQRPGTWERAGAALLFRRSDDRVTLELRLTAEAGELRFRPVVTNHTQQPVSRVRFTLWQGGRLNGTLFAATNRHPAGSYDAPQSKVSPQQFVHDWFCLFDGKATLHGRLEDRLLLDSTARYGRPEAGVFTQIEKYPCIKPGQSWAAPDLVLGADRTGTWYAAADRYRQWFDSWAKRPVVPAWFKAIGGFTTGGDVYETDALAKNQAMVKRARDLSGVPLFHTGAWLPLLTEAWYPLNYRLDAAQLARFAEIAAAVRADGGRFSIYSNALMFSRVTPDYAAYGKELTVIGSDGFPIYSEHDRRHHPMALPWPNSTWAKRYCDALEPVIAKGRPDLLYMDQLGAVPTHLDYALERHGHEHYGEWRRVQAEFCEVVEKRFRPLQPDLVTGIECPNIAAQQFTTFALLVHTDYEILRYTFPQFVSFIGEYSDGVAPEAMRRYAKEALLSGQPLLFFTNAAAGLDQATRRDIREMVLCKRQFDPLLYAARCQASRGVVPQDDVEAFGFVGQGEWLLTYVKANATATSVILDPAGFGCPAVVAARVVAPDGTSGPPLTVRQVRGKLKIQLPAGPFGLIRLSPVPVMGK
jgi:hypothetical protein